MPDQHSEGRFSERVALVTGGASGIGLAAVERFVRDGARVVIADLDTKALADVEGRLGDAVVGVECDVTQEPDVERMAQTAIDRWGRLDIAYANAGVGTNAAVVDTELADWQRVLDVCLTGVMLTVKHSARRMTAGGALVVTTSLNAIQPGVGMGAYCAAKAGAAMLVQCAAMELGPSGIRINAVAPGLVRTPMTDGMWLMPAIVDAYEENTALHRYATPDEIANVVAFLASDEASFVTGSLHLIDGGAATMKYPNFVEIAQRALSSS